MPINKVGELIIETDDKLWRMLEKYIELSREFENFSELKSIGIDETSKRKHHEYITLFVDMKKRKTVFITEGKSSETVKDFKEDLELHGGNAQAIENVSCDISPAFIKGVKENLPNAQITFDKFHVLKIINDAVYEVRKEEAKNFSI